MTRHGPAIALDRRRFLALGGAAGASSILWRPAAARATPPAAETPARPATNLIFMVSDGMAAGTLQLADLMIRRRPQNAGRPSNWVRLIEDPRSRRAVVNTSSADSIVTDSAAASTAWGIGELAENGAIGLTPDGRMPSPILMSARARGKAIGLVTTTRLTHATPAGFIANCPVNRDREDIIADQMIRERLPEAAFGGGARFLTPELLAEAKHAAILRTRADFAALDPARETRPVLGIFNHSHMSWELDRLHQPEAEREPSLAEMTDAALALLARRSGGGAGGFAVQIEGGRVDHAGHNNDAGSLLREQAMFDDALGRVLSFMEGRDDTLLIVTADHATANPGLTDYTRAGNEGFARACEARRSFEWIERKLKEAGDPPAAGQARAIIEEATGVALRPREIELLLRRFAGEPIDPFRHANADGGPLGSLLANHTGVAFLSTNHTSDFVELTAIGPGSELVPPMMRICDVHGVMMKALDLAPARPV